MKVLQKRLTQRKGSSDSSDIKYKMQKQSSIGGLKSQKDSIALVNEKLNPASPMTQREESVLDFTDNQRSLIGRISIYKINFKKNLRRF